MIRTSDGKKFSTDSARSLGEKTYSRTRDGVDARNSYGLLAAGRFDSEFGENDF